MSDDDGSPEHDLSFSLLTAIMPIFFFEGAGGGEERDIFSVRKLLSALNATPFHRLCTLLNPNILIGWHPNKSCNTRYKWMTVNSLTVKMFMMKMMIVVIMMMMTFNVPRGAICVKLIK